MAQILQKAKLVSFKTVDGIIDYSNSGVPLGLEFYIQANSFQMRDYVVGGPEKSTKVLMVKALPDEDNPEKTVFMAAELLEYISDFKVKGV